MAARHPDEIRRSLEAARGELTHSLGDLQSKLADLADWRRRLRENRRAVLVGAAAAGFLVGGGVAATIGLFRR